MRIEVLPEAEEVARRAASVVAAQARRAAAERGRFCLALSGGTTPWRMLRILAGETLPWESVHLFQVDERVAPDGDPDRNWTHIREALVDRVTIPGSNLHPMPVGAQDLEVGASSYARELELVTGRPAVLDLVHLGLGADGHTASLVPGDPVLGLSSADVGLSRPYGGHVRMTLTYPALDRARLLVWVVTGAEKARALASLRASDPSVPAGRVRSEGALVLADADAAAQPGPTRP